jgi:hypothetical protein
MKDVELSKGNLVYASGFGEVRISELNHHQCTIYNKDFSENTATSYDKICGIVLTEEWFKNNAPCKDENGFPYFQDFTCETMRFYLSIDGYIQWVKYSYSPFASFDHIRHVHQFQNLFYMLVNKELPLT